MEHLINGSFDEKIAKGIVLVDFYADWCGPCEMLSPILLQLSEEMKEVSFYKVDIDSEKILTQKLNIHSVPTLLLFKDGELKAKTAGYSPKELIKSFIEKIL